MKIITLNTWGSCGPWEQRWAQLVQELVFLKPDILFLQEVWNAELPEKIKNALPYSYLCTAYEAGLVILSKIQAGLYKIHKYQALSPHESYDRRALLVKTKIGSHHLILANTHLSWKTEDGETRKNQVGELLREVKKSGCPAILAGDFNNVPESEAVQKIKAAGFQDAFDACGRGPGFTWDNANPFIQSHETKFPDRRIDYLFLSGALAKAHPFLSCRVVFNQASAEGIYSSDHYGVAAEIKL